MSRLVSAAIAALVVVTPTLAQEKLCPETGIIPWLGGMVLESRKELPRLQARNYGADAAYLTVRYSPSLSEESAEAFLMPLFDEDIRGIKDVVFAWSVAARGLAATREAIGPDQMDALALASPTTVRALVDFDADDIVMHAFAALDDEAATAEIRNIYIAMVDLPDERKAEVASYAEERGHYVVAGAIYALMRDPEPWPAFLARVPHGLAEPLGKMFGFFPLYVGNDAPAPPGSPEPNVWTELNEVAAAAALQPEFEFINPYLSQTGHIDAALAAAGALRQAIDSGAIARDGAMDEGWLLAYRAFKGIGDPSADLIDPTLESLRIGLRPLRQTSAEVLAWMLAVDALRPYLRGEADAMPAEMPGAPGGLLAAEWPQWQALAEKVRNEPNSVVPDGTERSLAIAAELLFAAGQYEVLAAMLGSIAPPPIRAALADDFMKRLDRQCESYLWHPAESLLLIGQQVYKFGDVSREPDPPPPGPEAAPADRTRMKN